MKRALLFAFAAILMVGLAPGASALHAPSTTEKKKCKIVIKVVHGHKRKVRVCHTVKPPPTVKNISISLDNGRGATKTIGPEGGSITATAADGTTYTLALPKDALVGATEVRVIPVKSVAGLSGHARVVGAVQFEPEGLGLFKPATLTITPSSLSSKPTQAFSWYGAGRTLGRYPSKRTGTRLELQITHFSGDGVAQGESSDWAGWESMANAVRTHYQQSVRPLMTRAETDDSVFVRAMQDYNGWARQIALLRANGLLDEAFTSELEGLATSAKKALRNYVEKASERCVNQHKLGEIVILVMAARQAALLGDEQQAGEALEKARKCGHFELDYETIITRRDPPFPPNSETRAESHVRVLGLQLEIQFGTEPASGEKQIEYLGWNYTLTNPECRTVPTGTQLGDPFRVTRFLFEMEQKSLAGPDGRPQFAPPTISLLVYPGKPTEFIAVDCKEAPRIELPGEHYYYSFFSSLYFGQAEGDSFRIDGWDILGGSVYARKTYERTKVVTDYGGDVTERTTYDLKHTPK